MGPRCWLSGQEQQEEQEEEEEEQEEAGGRRQDTGGGKEGWHRSTLRCFKHCRKSAPFLIRTFFMIGLAGMRIAKGFVG